MFGMSRPSPQGLFLAHLCVALRVWCSGKPSHRTSRYNNIDLCSCFPALLRGGKTSVLASCASSSTPSCVLDHFAAAACVRLGLTTPLLRVQCGHYVLTFIYTLAH